MSNFYGLKFEPLPVRDYSFSVCCASASDIEIPDEYELPANLIPLVHDQGNTGRCVSFSMCQCAESQALSEGESVHYSPGWIYGRDEVRRGYDGEGLYATTALKGAVEIGFVPEMYFDFEYDVPEILELANERDDLLEIGNKRKPTGYMSMSYALDDKMWDSIKRAIYVYKRPVVLISHDYFRGGSHAILGYGYTNTNGKNKGRYIKFQNSWGLSWSGDGRSTIPINYIDGAYMFTWEEIRMPFSDVTTDDWFYNDVRAMYLSELMNGVSETTFNPNDDISRCDMALIIDRLLDKSAYSINTFVKSAQQKGVTASPIKFATLDDCPIEFVDVEKDAYFYDGVYNTCANGIMNGISSGEFPEFAPFNSLTRAEAATIVVRTIEKIREHLNRAVPKKSCNIPYTNCSNFSDVSKDSWYALYVIAANSYGLMQGNGDGTFSPESNITRAEAAAILRRLSKAIDNLLHQFG